MIKKDAELLATIRKLYDQQKEMFYEHKHRVGNRIVSIAQPFVRPIVCGKAKAPVEFGAKYDVSINERGHAWLEKVTFDPYNEGSILCDVIERYRERTGHYPARVLVDKIYRTKADKAFCNEHGIEMSGRKVGRPPKDNNERRKLEKLERKNDTGHIEVERFFSLEKRCCGAGLIMTKLSEPTLGSIVLSVLANLLGIDFSPNFLFYFLDLPSPDYRCHIIEIDDTISLNYYIQTSYNIAHLINFTLLWAGTS